MKPKFLHECSDCLFLGSGTYLNRFSEFYDCQGLTIVVRYGDEPHEYASAPIELTDHGVVKAAIDAGLDSKMAEITNYRAIKTMAQRTGRFYKGKRRLI